MNKCLTFFGAVVLFLCTSSLSNKAFAQNTSQALQSSSSKTLSPAIVDELSLEQELRLKPLTIASQYIVGQFFGGVSGFIFGLGATAIFQCDGAFCEFGEFAAGALVGYWAGSALGVYVIGNNAYRTASYPVVLLGDAIGLVAAGTIASNLSETTSFGETISIISALTLPMAGAILAYSLTQKKKSLYRTALLNISSNNLSVSSPSISVARPSLFGSKQFLPQVSIVNFQF